MITFEIKGFSQKGKQRLVSDKKLIHGKYWELFVDPKGSGSPGYVSIYLSMNHTSSFCYVNGNAVNYTFTLSMIHPTSPSKNACNKIENSAFDHKVSYWGCADFIKLSKLNAYLSNDTLLIECQIYPEYKNIYIKPSIIINESLSMEDSVLLTDKHDYYPIQNGSHAKGYIFIVSNSKFDSSNFPSLSAYEADVEKIRNVCTTNLAIHDKDIEIHHNVSSVKTLEVFDNLSKKDFTSYDYIMVFILSHGYSGCIVGTDGVAIPYLHLQQYLYPNKCSSLKEKPKCFFLQGCRTQPIPLTNILPSPPSVLMEPTKSTLSIVTKPHHFSEEEADFLFACACVDFSIAWTNTVTGSWYITQLCKSLAYFSHSHHLLDMLLKVNQLLYKMSRDVEKYGVVSQISVPSHTFTRKFRFFETTQADINVCSSSSSSSDSSNHDMISASPPIKSFALAAKMKGDQQAHHQKPEAGDKAIKNGKNMPMETRLSFLKRKFDDQQEGIEKASSGPSKLSDLLFEDPMFSKRFQYH